MDNHSKKMIAPIVITAILVFYFFSFFILCCFIPLPLMTKLLFVVVPLLLGGVSIYVLIQRIQEIRSGEEDDLSQY